jgi:kinesin family member 1
MRPGTKRSWRQLEAVTSELWLGLGHSTPEARCSLFRSTARTLTDLATSELNRNAKCIVSMQNAQTVLQPPPDAEERLRKGGKGGPDGQKTFAFDKSYWSFDKSDKQFAGQDNLFADLGNPLLDNAFKGYNNCIFAYGQTGSGKSYSMMGYGEEPGVIPRICRDMFDRISSLQKDPNLTCTVEVSYLEIYNERVRDLLNPSTKGNLRVREHPSTGPYVEDLAKLVVQSFPEIENLMDEGNKARTVAATNMNETSSRSHAVFTLTLTQKRHDVETAMDTEKVAKISLVDLAGSERQSATGASGARLKEGAEINRSLSTLGRVIATLADISSGKKKNMSMVPYRDSVLTWLLKDSLGGNSMTAMIAAISPADINFEETLSTLRYADSAKRIKNHAVVNEDPNARMIRELKEELAHLRSKLGGGSGSAGINDEIYPPGTPLHQQIVSITQADGSIKKVSKAEIVEQLNQSEKLYKDLNQTWEEKLQKTEEIHKEREAALEELGISIEKGFVGLTTPKKTPHLVNLSDDPLLAECLIYNIKPGTTTVGNVDTSTNSEIRLNGSKIQHRHCTFENADNVVTLIPSEGAAVMVNGLRINEPKRLRSGNRIILGDFHIFRFNNPQEARAERAEQSLLRHSVTISQLGSPAPPRPYHERSTSRADSEPEGDSSRPESPIPSFRGRDSDWSFARREAASAILGPDQKIAHLTDDELDNLFDDVLRAREKRRGRAESRFFENEEDSDSLTSFTVRDKYLSNGTFDNFSLDTAITMPGTPLLQESPGNEQEIALKAVHDDMQRQLDQQKDNYQEELRTTDASAHTQRELQEEKERMEEALLVAKAEFQTQLQDQKAAYESQIKEISQASPTDPSRQGRQMGPHGSAELSPAEIGIARSVSDRWQELKYVRITESILQSAALLKEAQVLSRVMEKHVGFQFVVLDTEQHKASSYDLVLHDISSEDDVWLEEAKKPCLAVRVMDFQNSVILFWSTEKLRQRVQRMRQIHQYIDRPEYIQHFRLQNPFSEFFIPQFSFLGDGTVPLTAVFDMKVQDFAVEIISPYTQGVLGVLRLSLEPSSAHGPTSTIKFNVVVHDIVGFAEREGTHVHAQLYVAGASDDNGITTTQTVSDFDEGPIRFESVHSLSIRQQDSRDSMLKVAVYAQLTSMHLDKLISWDEIRCSADAPSQQQNLHRLPESEYHSEERHDVFARVQILELSENGQYLPVEVVQSSALDAGVYQLHQGVQRRISITLTHSLSESLPWEDLTALRVGEVHLIDSSGKIADLDSQTPDILLKQIQEPMIKDNADGTSNITIVGQWDSSLHNSQLLDRATFEKHKIQVALRWNVISSRVHDPVVFSLEQQLQILPRSYTRPQSILKSFWNQTRVTHSTDRIFCVTVRPVSAKRAADLWRMDTQHDYVNGEELLANWAPRRVSLVRDFIASRKRQRWLAEVEAAKSALASRHLSVDGGLNARASFPSPLEPRQEKLLRKFVGLWAKQSHHISDTILMNSNLSPDQSRNVPHLQLPYDPDTSTSSHSSPSKRPLVRPRFIATVTSIPKNPTSLKSGYLLMPSETQNSRFQSMQWVRRFVDLRPPYLHIHSVPGGDAINAINLAHARIDHEPDFKRLLGGDQDHSDSPSSGGERGSRAHSTGLTNVFAVYGEHNTFLFAARTETQKVDWILKIDQSYFSGSSAEGGTGDDL